MLISDIKIVMYISLVKVVSAETYLQVSNEHSQQNKNKKHCFLRLIYTQFKAKF